MKKVFEQPIVNLESLQASEAVMADVTDWDLFDWAASAANV